MSNYEYLDFNPRSHERSDSSAFFIALEIIISIHAPTRGATYLTYKAQKYIIFQSTLPREERRVAHVLGALGVYRFQSTLPREERPMRADRVFKTLLYFNPRSHERSDSNIAQKICLFLYNTDNKYIIR